MENQFNKTSNGLKILAFIGLFIGCGIVSTIITVPLVLLFKNNLLFINAIATIFWFGGSAFAYQMIFSKKEIANTFCQNLKWKTIVIAIFVFTIITPLASYFSVENGNYNNLMLENIKDTSYLGLVSLIISMALIPAIIEEWFFRGVLQKIMIDWTKYAWIGILITSIIFSLIHFDIDNFVARLILGLALGLTFYYTKNIWTNILVHFINNSFAAIEMWLLVRQNKTLDDENMPWYLALTSLIVCIIVIVYLEKKNKKNILKKIKNEENIEIL